MYVFPVLWLLLSSFHYHKGDAIRSQALKWSVTEDIIVKPYDKSAGLQGNIMDSHSCYLALRTGVEHKIFCYPYIVISGTPKAGTSALFQLLESHPNFYGGERKELCPASNSTGDVWAYFTQLQRMTNIAKRSKDTQVLVNGCINQKINIMVHAWLRQPRTNYLVLTRDLGDLVWATYNFWCFREYDHCDSFGSWADRSHDYRSAGMFHELVLSQKAGKFQYSFPAPLRYNIFPSDRNDGLYQLTERIFIEGNISSDQVVFIASEAMDSNVSSVWARIVEKTHISIPQAKFHPNLEHFGSIRVNTGV